MSPEARQFMQQLCADTRGMHADGVIESLATGRQAGLTNDQTMAAIRELAALRYVTHGTVSRAVFLTDNGASWCQRGRWADDKAHAADQSEGWREGDVQSTLWHHDMHRHGFVTPRNGMSRVRCIARGSVAIKR